MEAEKSVVDKSWSENVLRKLKLNKSKNLTEPEHYKTKKLKNGRKPRPWAELSLGQQFRESGIDFKKCRSEARRIIIGYSWHAPEPPSESLVGLDATMEKGVITAVNVAGRPSSKHRGKQGQHTTAFSTNREVVVAAVIGRTEEVAREDLAFLFEQLLLYPAFTSKTQPVPDEDLLITVKELANPESDLSTKYSIAELATLYLEMRDALPGASIDTGVDSNVGNRENILGKGEGSTLALLRGAEENGVSKEGIDSVAAKMLDLYDMSSEKYLNPDDVAAQRETFLRTVAQAFPNVFSAVGKSVAKGLEKDVKEDFQGLAGYLESKVCARLAKNNTTGKRPKPDDFVTVVAPENIKFFGRPDTIKDGSSLGDHTCAEQLMKDAAANIFLRKDEKGKRRFPTNSELLDSLVTLSNAFSPEDYEFFGSFDESEESDNEKSEDLEREESEESEELDDSDIKYPYELRYARLYDNYKSLSDMIDRLKGEEYLDNDLAGSSIIHEAADIYINLVDDRPTAVGYKGPAGGRDEGRTLATAREIENQADKIVFEKGSWEDLGIERPYWMSTVMGLFDSQSAVYVASEVFAEHYDQYLDLVAQEFIFFVKNAYPATFTLLNLDEAGLAMWVKRRIVEEGGLERKEKEYREPDVKKRGRGLWEAEDSNEDEEDKEELNIKKKKIKVHTDETDSKE